MLQHDEKVEVLTRKEMHDEETKEKRTGRHVRIAFN